MNTPAVSWAIEADSISYAYPDGLEALTDLTLHVGQGELAAIVGPNGAGKSTLMKVLLRLLRPGKGQVCVGSRDIAQMRPNELYRRVGMVLQNPADQLFGNTVEHDVAFGPSNLGLADVELRQCVDEALTAVDAQALRDRPIHRLSYGEQKRVCLAGVLAMKPEILVLDEPLAGLDSAGEARMIDLLLRLNRERSTTIIISTHSVDLLPVLADRIYVLSGGRVALQGSPREVFSNIEAIERVGLRLPLISQLFRNLNQHAGPMAAELPLTVAEAQSQILRWLADSRSAPERGGSV